MSCPPSPRGVRGRVRTVIFQWRSGVLSRFRPGSVGKFNFYFGLKYGWVMVLPRCCPGPGTRPPSGGSGGAFNSEIHDFLPVPVPAPQCIRSTLKCRIVLDMVWNSSTGVAIRPNRVDTLTGSIPGPGRVQFQTRRLQWQIRVRSSVFVLFCF